MSNRFGIYCQKSCSLTIKHVNSLHHTQTTPKAYLVPNLKVESKCDLSRSHEHGKLWSFRSPGEKCASDNMIAEIHHLVGGYLNLGKNPQPYRVAVQVTDPSHPSVKVVLHGTGHADGIIPPCTIQSALSWIFFVKVLDCWAPKHEYCQLEV